MKKGQNEFTSQEKSKVKIKIDTSKCISAATCLMKAPETFDLDESGIAYTKETTWDEAETIVEAAISCPTMAIIVEDLEGNQLWPSI